MNPTYRFVRSTVFLSTVLWAVHGSESLAAPTGGRVVTGQGSISQSGNTTTVDQQTQSLSLDWLSFSIAPAETVRFVQPSSTAIALNRVVGNDPSQIYGHLQANGQVFLINPNGVLFGSTAQVNVGGLVASSLNLTDADILNGHYRFQSASADSRSSSTPASVVNEGVLNASAGSSIALLGGQVSNRGVITAQLGTVALAAGSAITVDFSGNRVLTVQVEKGAAGALAENRQLIQADGGKVIMTAAARDALLNAVVNNTGVIEARTIQNESGEISLLGGEDGGTVSVAGTLDASAPNGGNGGAIETSGTRVQVADSARISTAAAAGKTGTWLVDPTDFTITPNGGDISGAALDTALASNNVTLSTTSGKVSGNGDLFVDDTVHWSANTTLTLNAVRNVVVNSSITADGNTAGVALTFGSGGDYSLNYGSQITFNGTNPSFSINGQGYTVINSLGAVGDTSGRTLQGMNGNLSGYYALGRDINASASGGFSTGGFVPIGTGGTQAFNGTLAGLGHAIKDLTVDPNINSGKGLIGFAGTGSVIRDLGIEGATVAAAGKVVIGALVGENHGSIANTYANNVAISGIAAVGGLVGQNYGSITNSLTTGTVTATGTSSGGLAGYNAGTIRNAYSTASVNGQSGITGGLVGDNGGTIDHSYATGSVSSSDFIVGGLVGINESGSSLLNSHATGSVSSQGVGIGGLAGENQGTLSGSYATGNVTATATGTGGGYVGGLVGWNVAGGTISASYYLNPTGQVNGGSLRYIGGLVGYNTGIVDQSYATTSVIGGGSVGGLVGTAAPTASATVTRSYSTGSVSGTGTDIGGLIGTNYEDILDCYTGASVSGSGSNIGGFIGTVVSGTITSSYWIASGTTTATTDTSGAAKLSATEAEQPSSFVNWDFATDWRIYAGHTSPLLRTFLSPLTVTAGTITTTYNGQDYAGGLSNPTYSVAGAATSGHVQVSTTPYAGDRNAGSYGPPDLWSDQQGYDISLVGGGLTINKAPLTITTSDVVKTYDGTTSASGNAVATSGTQVFGGDSLSGGTFAFTDKNAGVNNKTVTVSGVTVVDGNGGNNYTVKYADNTTSTINRAALSLAASSSTKIYDGTTASTGAVTETGAITGDSVSATESYESKNVLGTAGSMLQVNSNYTIIDSSGADMSGNYTVTKASAAGTINPAPLTVTSGNVVKTYDGTISAAGSAISTGGTQLFGTDSLSGGTFAFTDKNAGVGNKTVSVSGVTITDDNAGKNYTVTYTNNTGSTINKASLTLAASSSTKTYDGTTASAGTVNETGAASGDAVAATEVYTSKNVMGLGASTLQVAGGYTITDASGADMSGNYMIATTSAAGTINPAILTVNGATAANKIYDGSAVASISGGSLSGVLGSDSVALLQSGSFSDKNAGTTKPVAEIFALTGKDTQDYVLASNSAQTTASITPLALTITANNGIKAAGAANPALSVSYSGFLSGENASSLTTLPTATTTADTTSAPGAYAITVSGAVDPNYTFTYVPGTLLVTGNPATGIYPGALSSVTQTEPVTGDPGNPKSKSEDGELYAGMLDIDTPKRVTDALPILSLIILDKGVRLPEGVQ